MVFNYSSATTYCGGHCYIVGLFNAPSGLKIIYESISHSFGTFITVSTAFLPELKLLKFPFGFLTKCCCWKAELSDFKPTFWFGSETKCRFHVLVSTLTLAQLFAPCSRLADCAAVVRIWTCRYSVINKLFGRKYIKHTHHCIKGFLVHLVM